MNVLITADYGAPSSGNFIASLLELAERMREAGNRVSFLFPDKGRSDCIWLNWLEDSGFSVQLMDMSMSEDEKVAVLEKIVSANQIDLIHSHGMKAGLWIEPEVVGMKCQKMIDYYGDECFIQRNGKKVCELGRYLLDFRHEKVRAYLSETIDRMVNEYGCDYIKPSPQVTIPTRWS